jgi:hypothetical protein
MSLTVAGGVIAAEGGDEDKTAAAATASSENMADEMGDTDIDVWLWGWR